MIGGGAEYAGYVLGGAGLLSMAWSYWSNRRVSNAQASATEADASGKVGLIEALEARIAAGEKRQNEQAEQIASLFKRIDEEIVLRHAAQEENLKLRMRVTELEHAIRQLGGVVPVAA